jgi:hypothetical protein
MNGKNELGYHLNNKYITETIKTKTNALLDQHAVYPYVQSLN